MLVNAKQRQKVGDTNWLINTFLTKLHVDKENIKKLEKQSVFWGNSNPKRFWKTLKQFGLQEKRSSSADTCLTIKEGLTFNCLAVSEAFKKLYSILANDLVKTFPTAA